MTKEVQKDAYRVDVIDYGSYVSGADSEWASNGKRFDTEQDAAEYAGDLACRWTALRCWRVVNTESGEVFSTRSYA